MENLPDLRQLKAFVAVAETGSFTRAARQLHLTQSAVSHSIRTLESQLACKLLERSSRNVTPTTEGEWFLRRCRKVIDELSLACRELQQAHADTVPMTQNEGGGLQRSAS